MLEQSRFKKAVQTRHIVLHVCNPALEKLGEWIIHEFEAILGYTKFQVNMVYTGKSCLKANKQKCAV